MQNQKQIYAWQPSAALNNLKLRAGILALIRDFFKNRNVMEVDTPLMCHTSVTDPFIQSIPALFQAQGCKQELRYYLQTSPEYAMKRLLAASSGDIYQICKAFRQGEVGRLHNPEFSMIEWYRLGFDHHTLMDEVDALLQLILDKPPSERLSYQEVFMRYLQINPHQANLQTLISVMQDKNISVACEIDDKDTCLQLLMSEYIEPQIGQDKPCFIYDFPASQAALARLNAKDTNLASRFEVYFKGIELANGFHELQNANEQRQRFEKNLIERKQHSLNEMIIDEFFMAALSQGLPDCSGVALGIDRLIMLAIESSHITDVLSFDFSRV